VHADACAWTSNGACHLIIPSNGPVRNRAAYRRHELAHCNGWDHANSAASGPANEQDPLKPFGEAAFAKRRRDSSRERRCRGSADTWLPISGGEFTMANYRSNKQ
jgi:hypothetical protein